MRDRGVRMVEVGAGPLPETAQDRAVARLRWVAARGVSAVVAGGLVLGVGGRLVMLVSRLLHPDAVGRATENGNLVGQVTLGGTVALLVFGGLLSGAMAGIIWVVLRRWLPDQAVAVAVAVVAIGGPVLVDGTNRDFDVLDPPGVDVAMLIGLLAMFGVALRAVDRRLGPMLERPTTTSTAVAGITVALGAALAVPTAGFFVSRSFCFCEHPPVWTGASLGLAAVGSAWWWVAEARGSVVPPPAAVLLGRGGTIAAVVLGAVDLVGEVRLAVS